MGGSGSKVEVRKALDRRFITAEIDERYYKMILDRLNSGHSLRNTASASGSTRSKNVRRQLVLLEEQSRYLRR